MELEKALIEPRPQLGAANVFVVFSTAVGDDWKVVPVVEENSISMVVEYKHDERQYCHKLETPFSLQCDCYSGLTIDNSIVTFRVKLKNVNGLGEVKLLPAEKHSWSPSVSVFYKVTTRCCSWEITKRFQCQRVLPLPTDNWEAFSGDAFCHKHDFKNKLEPREGDILIATRYNLVHADNLISKDVSATGKLHCELCHTVFGWVSCQSVQLWNHLVQWEDQDESHSCSAVENLYAGLRQCSRDRPAVMFKVFVECWDCENKPVLLWIIEQNLKILVYGSDKLGDQHCVMRIMYKYGSEAQDDMVKLKHDMSVQYLTVDNLMMKALVDNLTNSTSFFPPSFNRAQEGYIMGYL